MGKLKSPARVGNTIFKEGVDESLVVKCAQRLYEELVTVNKKDLRELKKSHGNRVLK